MAELTFNAEGWRYSTSLSSLYASFRAANEALLEAFERAQDEMTSHQERVDAGETDDVMDHTEDGTPLVRRHKLLEYEVRAEEAATQDLRKAYVLALYHTWERGARAWTGSNQKHGKLISEVEACGYAVHPALERLYLSRTHSSMMHTLGAASFWSSGGR